MGTYHFLVFTFLVSGEFQAIVKFRKTSEDNLLMHLNSFKMVAWVAIANLLNLLPFTAE